MEFLLADIHCEQSNGLNCVPMFIEISVALKSSIISAVKLFQNYDSINSYFGLVFTFDFFPSLPWTQNYCQTMIFFICLISHEKTYKQNVF